jgi:hypothetical protein
LILGVKSLFAAIQCDLSDLETIEKPCKNEYEFARWLVDEIPSQSNVLLFFKYSEHFVESCGPGFLESLLGINRFLSLAFSKKRICVKFVLHFVQIPLFGFDRQGISGHSVRCVHFPGWRRDELVQAIMADFASCDETMAKFLVDSFADQTLDLGFYRRILQFFQSDKKQIDVNDINLKSISSQIHRVAEFSDSIPDRGSEFSLSISTISKKLLICAFLGSFTSPEKDIQVFGKVKVKTSKRKLSTRTQYSLFDTGPIFMNIDRLMAIFVSVFEFSGVVSSLYPEVNNLESPSLSFQVASLASLRLIEVKKLNRRGKSSQFYAEILNASSAGAGSMLLRCCVDQTFIQQAAESISFLEFRDYLSTLESL